MLTRIRIEVSDEDSAAATEAALTKYEEALHQVEGRRFGLPLSYEVLDLDWEKPTGERVGNFNEELGREVTDEVIEYDASLPGYKGRRVVQFRRLDTRSGSDPTPEGNASEAGTNTTVTVHGSIDGRKFAQSTVAGRAFRP